MVCKRCGYQNSEDAKYCARCGQWLDQEKKSKKNIWIAVAVCVLTVAIGIGTLLFAAGNSGGIAGRRGTLETGSQKVTAQITADIRQVLPIEDGSVAVLYTDGAVRVSGNTQFSEVTQEWRHVAKIYYNNVVDWRDGEYHYETSLLGLTEDGRVLATDGKLSSWNNVKELHFSWQGIVGVTQDGRVLAEGEDVSFLTDLTNVETLVYSEIDDIWGCLKKDGCVTLHGSYINTDEIRWNNVKELRNSDHAFYVIKKDGTVDGGLEDDQSGLNGAVKIVDYEDWLFGISADGRLLTHNGGNIYTNTGDMMVDVPGASYYGGEVDISQFNQVADIVTSSGLILLNKDGTVDAIGVYPSWDLSDWSNIKKICSMSDADWENITLYGIKQNGSVIITRYNWNRMSQTVTDQYHGWMLQDIYPGNGGVIGLTVDGKLVGDGIYENVDFSVFE